MKTLSRCIKAYCSHDWVLINKIRVTAISIPEQHLNNICNWQFLLHPSSSHSQQTQNICITFVYHRLNVCDVGPILYKCYTNVWCLLGYSTYTSCYIVSYYFSIISHSFRFFYSNDEKHFYAYHHLLISFY